jgi:hypothetical protein
MTAIAFLGISQSKWDHQVQPYLPKSAIMRDEKHRVFAYGPAVIKLLLQQGVQEIGDEDELLAGGSNPELIKAKIELLREQIQLRRFDVQAKQESIVPRDQVHEVFAVVAGFIRDGVDKLQRVYGAEAYDLMMEKIEDAERTIRQRFGDSDTRY